MNEITTVTIGSVIIIVLAFTGDHPQAEYMLMGTFLSLAITLAVGLSAKFLVGLL